MARAENKRHHLEVREMKGTLVIKLKDIPYCTDIRIDNKRARNVNDLE